MLWEPCKGLDNVAPAADCKASWITMPPALAATHSAIFCGVSEPCCSLVRLWKMHHNLAPRKFTYFKKQIAGLFCPFVMSSLKQTVWCVSTQLSKQSLVLSGVCLFWKQWGRRSAPCHPSAFALTFITFYFSHLKKNVGQVDFIQMPHWAGSPQCMLWLHYQMFNVDLNLNKTKQKRSFPNCTFSVVPPQKNLIAKTCEWGKNMRMIAKKCEFAYYWGKYCFLSGGIFPSTVNQFLLYHQSNFK